MIDEGVCDDPYQDDTGLCCKVTKGWKCRKDKGHKGECGKDSWVGPVEPSSGDFDIPAGD